MLAHMPPDRIDAIVERWGLPQYTEHTITTRAALDARLEQVRSTGIAVDDEERLRGVRCVAAPITDDEERPLGAISVSAPISRMPDALVDSEVAMEVISVAKAAELDLKYG
jgi:DNA-binding IclR family transcriptional regulator